VSAPVRAAARCGVLLAAIDRVVDKNVDLHWLRAAIDNAIEAGAER
jgi:hypothetical protein